MLAIFGKSLPDSFLPQVDTISALLKKSGTPFCCFKTLHDKLLTKGIEMHCQTYSSSEDLPSDTILILCLGGDGTMLETLTIVKERQIPIVGVNTGKLGFLSEIFPHEISKSIDNLLKEIT